MQSSTERGADLTSERESAQNTVLKDNLLSDVSWAGVALYTCLFVTSLNRTILIPLAYSLVEVHTLLHDQVLFAVADGMREVGFCLLLLLLFTVVMNTYTDVHQNLYSQ